MNRIVQVLIPMSQRQAIDDMYDGLDLGRGDLVRKRSAFLIMLVLSAVIAVAGVLADSTATVIGAMIIAPLATPILGIALGIVTGHLSLVLRSLGWVIAGVGIVVATGAIFAFAVTDPSSLQTNSQVTGRTSPRLMDLAAALATGFAGAFAMCRRDLSAVLPGVAIAISLVPPLGVVGVCAGQGAWAAAGGALLLFLSNVLALVITGSIVFTLAGYAREPSSLPTAKRRRAYAVVGVLSAIVVIPLVLNTAFTIALDQWSARLWSVTEDWLADTPGAEVTGVTWVGLTATVDVSTPDGVIPGLQDLRASTSDLPDVIGVVVDVSIATEHEVR